jgi:acetolactate synthase-1/2/3 large subunit
MLDHPSAAEPADAGGQPHPRAGATLSGAEVIVEVLAQEGVRHIFGYSGGAILPTFDAVFRHNHEQASRGEDAAPIEMVVPANEQGAAFMASGYARASGEVGVVMVTSGPGATNTVTSVRDCMADSTPIVVLCGQVPTTAIGTDAFQEAPVSSIMGAACKHVFLVTEAERLEATLRTAFELARSGRPGPVVVDIPKNVQTAELTFAGAGRLPVPGYRQRMARLTDNPCSRAPVTERFFDMLRECEAPLLYVGGGAINGECGGGAVSELAKLCGIPGRDHLDGDRRLRHHRSAVTAHARHAWHRLRQLRRRGLRLPHRRGRALRRPRGRRAEGVRTENAAHRPFRHRRVGDQQGQAAWTGTTWACWLMR